MDLMKQKHWFDSPQFEKVFHSDAPLGAFPSSEGTLFRLWAPTAERVALRLYDNGTDGSPAAVHSMHPATCGLWALELPDDLDGTYYDYEVTVEGTARVTADPYAKACGVNGKRSMVLDLRRTDPEGWQKDKAPALPPEDVIWELHVKDFSHDPTGGFPPADRGKYSAFCRTGTTLNGDGVHPTGLDYMKTLGVTYVQLQPIYDFGSVDEAGPAGQFNWGYDPVNYNCPEGSYSSDPFHGEVRVRELKAAVQSLHKNGFRVVMDVVYNHTYQLDSCLFNAVPWYFYRQREDGSSANGSGCGNELATERSMCARYILDSVLYWAEEYHMDGFRFDLMGLMDLELMERIRKALDDKFGPGEKLVYGEPWQAEPAAARPGTVMCNKDHLTRLSPGVGAFCDATRDAVKGNVMDANHRGFVNGGGIQADTLRRCVTGWASGEGAYYLAPSQTISYLSCHDDWTLWDKLVATLDDKQDFQTLTPAVLRANRMAAAILFFCQGRIFFQAGEEFARTKDGVKNSYCSSPDINRLDWKRAWKNRELVDFYRGLIALRKGQPGLTDKSALAGGRVLSTGEPAPGCAFVTLDNRGGDSKRSRLLLLCNGDQTAHEVTLPEGSWQVLVDDRSAFRWQESATHSGKLELPGISAWILGKVHE